jgi:hypothetical protein
MIGSNTGTNMLDQMDMLFIGPIIEARQLISLTTYLSFDSQMKAHSFKLTSPSNFHLHCNLHPSILHMEC